MVPGGVRDDIGLDASIDEDVAPGARGPEGEVQGSARSARALAAGGKTRKV